MIWLVLGVLAVIVLAHLWTDGSETQDWRAGYRREFGGDQ